MPELRLEPINRIPLAIGLGFKLSIDREVVVAGEFWLSDGQWERLRPLLPNKPREVPRVDDRRVISGIV